MASETIVGEGTEKELYDAALKGDVNKTLQLLQKHPYLVNGLSFPCSRNLLHISTLWGEVAIVEELLKINQELARDVDSKNSSPLHIAAAKGHVEITKTLLEKAPEMLWCRDGQGMNPVHVAAMNGHVEILEEMLQLDLGPAVERVHRGQTVLHLCAKHRRLEALKFLVKKELGELVCAKDDDGLTLMDCAISCRQSQDVDDHLHIATLWGQLAIVKELVKTNPKLARNVDSQKSSPLHIVAAEKYLGIPQQDIQSGLWICDDYYEMTEAEAEAAKRNFEIALELLRAAPDMLWCRNDQGMNPVHVAAMNAHVDILKEMLQLDPGPAMERVHRGQTVLHLCVEHDIETFGLNRVYHHRHTSNYKIALELLENAPEMLWCRDDQGMNPVHVAAMIGHVEILDEMLKVDLGPAMERVRRGRTVLHLCVKHGRLRELKFLGEKLGDLVSAKDDDGETLLHCAARRAAAIVYARDTDSVYIDIIGYLVHDNKIEKQSTNSMGKTAKQIFEEGTISSIYDEDIQRVKYMLTHKYYEEPFLGFLSNPSMLELISKRREQTMVVMTLIATMAFQAAVNPPGGVWQEDTSSHRAGEAVIAYTHPKMYRQLVRANTTAFVSSLATIFLVAVHQWVEKGFLLLFSTYVVWASLASIAISYGGSVLVTARPRPNTDTQSLGEVIKVVVAVSLCFFGATLLLHPIKWLWSWIKTTKRVQSLIKVLREWHGKWIKFYRTIAGPPEPDDHMV